MRKYREGEKVYKVLDTGGDTYLLTKWDYGCLLQRMIENSEVREMTVYVCHNGNLEEVK